MRDTSSLNRSRCSAPRRSSSRSTSVPSPSRGAPIIRRLYMDYFFDYSSSLCFIVVDLTDCRRRATTTHARDSFAPTKISVSSILRHFHSDVGGRRAVVSLRAFRAWFRACPLKQMLVILICFFRIVVFIRYDYLVFFSDEACTKRVEGTIEKCVAPRTPPRPRAAPATASVRRALHTLRLGRACAFPTAAPAMRVFGRQRPLSSSPHSSPLRARRCPAACAWLGRIRTGQISTGQAV